MMRYLKPILLCLLLVSAAAARAVTANFTADVMAGCSPLVVNFTNTSTGATSYSWNFGNGSSSVFTSPSTTYITAGTFTVTLTATGAGGATATHTMVITVYPLPTVNFVANDTTVCPGTPVSFTNTSSGGTPGPMTCTWNFGDGITGMGSVVTHAYSTAGHYNVTLTVQNSQGCLQSYTRNTYVEVYPKPTVAYTAAPASICLTSGTTTFMNSSTGAPVLTYLWRFGDGGTSTLASPSHTYSGPGAYNVSLTVTDGNGCVDSLPIAGYIHVGGPTASFTAPATACRNTLVSFLNTSSTHLSRTWTYGDGSPATTGLHGTHSYSAAGTYTVRLIISDGACLDTVQQTITIAPPGATGFTISPHPACPPPIGLTFNAAVTTPGTIVNWVFGDGTFGAGNPVTHTYNRRGIYTIKMITTTPLGCVDTITKQDTIYNLAFQMIDTPNHGCVPLNVNFDVDAKADELPDTTHIIPYPYGLASVTWNFGDGSPTMTGHPVSHVYTAVGVYVATVTAVTGNGCTVTRTDTIRVGTPPVISLAVAPTHICFNSAVTYTITVISGPVDHYKWDFDDGSGSMTSATPTVSHHFILPGVWTTTVTPIYNGCPGPTVVLPIPITVDSPKAQMNPSIMCTPPTLVNFANTSLGATSWLWMFGDGDTSTALNPSHNYPALGTYTVTLATYNYRTGCRDTMKQAVQLVSIVPDFTGTPLNICVNNPVTFTSSVTGGTATKYWWYVNGVFTGDTLANMTHLFTAPGLYSIKLAVADSNGCIREVNKPNYVRVAKPAANFSAAPTGVCAGSPVIFTDNSTDVPGTTFTNFYWTFGDGGVASVGTPTVSHTYAAAGVYTVTEIVTDNIGCKDTLTRPAYITVFKPHATFTPSTMNPCRGAPVSFTNHSTGIVSSYWMFGDGDTSTLYSPSHTYTATGTYAVKLVVTDAHGCKDTMTLTPGTFAVGNPSSGFNMSDSFAICAPLVVHFTSTSTTGGLYSWNFGDGNVSALASPSNIYTSPGVYTVTLVATSTTGCIDTVRRTVTIFGYAGALTYTPDTGCAPLTVYFNCSITNVTSILWDFADGTTATTGLTTTTTHTYLTPGAYVPKLVLSDNTGCQSSSRGLDTIKVDAIYPKVSSNPTPVCEGGTFNFIDSSTTFWNPVTHWLWQYGGTSSTLQSPVWNYSVAGTYSVTMSVSNDWGCVGNYTGNITIYPPPVITTSPDTVVCTGDPAILRGYGGTSYIWSPAGTLSCASCNPTNATPTLPTTYTVTGTDEHGCKNTDTVHVALRTKTFSTATGNAHVCQGIPVPLQASGGDKYLWLPAEGLTDPHSANPIGAPAATVTYSVVVQLGSCIPDTSVVTVQVEPLPMVNAGPDQWLPEGSTAQIDAVGANIYKLAWTPAGTLSCDTCMSTKATPAITTKYTINVTSEFGCTASDDIIINLYCANSQIFMPNSFTPNKDGQNDVYYPRGKGVKVVKAFRIYNRWGELLHEKLNCNLNDPSAGWDGWWLGDEPRPDVYVYYLEAECESGEPIFLKGDVTILR